MLLKLDAGVCPSTLLKSHNKWRKWSKTTNYSETVGKKMPSDEVYFTFLICTMGFYTATYLRSWLGGFNEIIYNIYISI